MSAPVQPIVTRPVVESLDGFICRLERLRELHGGHIAVVIDHTRGRQLEGVEAELVIFDAAVPIMVKGSSRQLGDALDCEDGVVVLY